MIQYNLGRNCYIMRNRNGVSKMSTEQYEKVPNGYYVVAMIFIFAALIEFLYITSRL